MVTTKTLSIGKYKHPTTIHKIKNANKAPWQKSACFESLYTAAFYNFELNGVADVMSFVSNELIIDMSAAFQESKYQANKIEESILYVDNLHPMEFVSAWGKYVKVNPDDSLEHRKEVISFFKFQRNFNAFLLDKRIAKATIQPLQLFLKPPKYLLSTDKNMRILRDHPPYQYQRMTLFHSSEEVNRITQYLPWHQKIYLIHIIPA